MKKLFKILVGILAAIGAMFVVFCFIPEDDYDEDDYYGDDYYEDDYGRTGSQSSSSSGYGYADLVSANESNESLLDLEGLRTKRDYSEAGTVTLLMYVNGSDLESDYSEATTDLSELISAGYNENVNILIETVGTKKWDSKLGIASDHSQRYKVTEDGLTLVDDSLGQLSAIEGDTLKDFISWGAANYPADRYILQMWDHGGGPVYGFGYDEYQSEDASLSIDEMQSAIKSAGVFFDFIGMDCCIMSNLETCCAMYDCCDYMILSEDFESGLGWSYKGWISALYANPSIDTADLAKIAIDDFVSSNESDSDGDSGILALVDESMMGVLYKSWTDFAYANEDTLLGNNYSTKRARKAGGRILPKMDKRNKSGFFDYFFEDDYDMADYYVTDIMAVAQNIDSDEAKALSSALYNSIVYCNCTSDCNSLTGLSITLPYGDDDFYSELKSVFVKCGIDESYVDWLEKFVSASGSSDYYDYDDWDDEWDGWSDYEDDYDWDDWDEWDDWDCGDYDWCEDYSSDGYYYDDGSYYDDGPYYDDRYDYFDEYYDDEDWW